MNRPQLSQLLTLVLSGGLAACAGSEAASVGNVNASFSIAAVSPLGVTPTGPAIIQADSDGDRDSVDFGGQKIRRSAIDSLIVTVTKVQVLPDPDVERCHPPVGDSINGFHPGDDDCGGDGHGGPMGPGSFGPGGPPPSGDDGPHEHPDRPDSLVPPDTGWGSHAREWFTLDVVSGGHLNLLALPTDTTNGIVLASASLPIGEYNAARLIVTSATIYFDTTFTTANGFTFKADTGYTVTLPVRDSVMGIMTKAGFTLSALSPTVVLAFDPRTMINGAIVSASGQILIRPVLHPCGRR
jgi:hypothetical protein